MKTEHFSAVDESEVAACLAAVIAYMAQDENAEPEKQERPSQWKLAALLNGVGKNAGYRVSTGASLWRGAVLSLGFCLIAASNICMPAYAGYQDMPAATAKQPIAALTPTATTDIEQMDGDESAPAVEPSPVYLRVAIALGAGAVDVQTPDGAEVRDAISGETIASLTPDGKWKLTARAESITLAALTPQSAIKPSGQTAPYQPVRYTPHSFINSQRIQLPLKSWQAPVSDVMADLQQGDRGYYIVPPPGDSIIGINGKLYRGSLWIQSSRSTPSAISAINVVELEDYLLSVVPSEMPSNWPAPALQAQAIAARSYALANAGKHESDGYDLKATTEDQVYSGISTETAATNQAVASTAGIVIKHNGKVVPGFFHSTSGGYTELAEYVWGNPLPYLKAVPDYDDASPHFSWKQSLPVEKLEDTLTQSGINVGDVLGMFVVSRSPTQRARSILITGSAGVHVLSSDEFRRLFHLPSTNFSFTCDQDCYQVLGRGFGHALGMSQWGARSLAEQGYNAAQILTYYYKDVALDYF